ncbi:syntaxin-17 [Dendroctonus ponderosae]|uniref:t-SNARE coiled-coil homology domain-containing protein n=1 Tax=Dendroctonus ponderosae TaxID=77166 RepID=A0AAR5P9Y1_DENPD|nr:syntaxin-17 [Dendroctonus ponderosae]
MKQYKMASLSSPSIIKQPLKFVEIPLNKFSEEVIPHHQRMLEQHKVYVHKLIALNNTTQLVKEIKDKKRAIKQLRDLLYELDTLRTQVEDNDLDPFDTKTMPLRSSILKLTKTYQDLEKAADKLIAKNQPGSPPEPSPNERFNPFEGASHIQIQADLDEIKLQNEQARLNRVQEIEQTSNDLKEMHRDLHQLVRDQGEQVDEIEIDVAAAEQNVQSGFLNIVKANKLNAVAYPATGAFMGTLLAGPIGFLAGFKIGGLAAIGCAFAGYAGGTLLKKQKDIDVNEAEHVINNENNENHTTVSENGKKDM